MAPTSTTWQWLSGKKTVIAACAAPVLAWMVVKGYMDADTMMMVQGVLTALGVGHKVQKSIKK